MVVIGLLTAAVLAVELPPLTVVESSTAPKSASRPAVSTPTVSRSGPFSISLAGDPNRPTVRFSYGLPLSTDLFGRSLFNTFLHPIDSFRKLGEDASRTTLNLYGLRLSPYKMVSSYTSSEQAGAGGGSTGTRTRRRLDLEPLITDVEEDLRRDAFFRGLELAAPQTRSLSRQQQQWMVDDFLKLDRQRDLPLLSLPASGIDFMLHPSTSTR